MASTKHILSLLLLFVAFEGISCRSATILEYDYEENSIFEEPEGELKDLNPGKSEDEPEENSILNEVLSQSLTVVVNPTTQLEDGFEGHTILEDLSESKFVVSPYHLEDVPEDDLIPKEEQGSLRHKVEVNVVQLNQSNLSDLPCSSPYTSVNGLGCITAITEWMYWDDAVMYCSAMGSRLLEGIMSNEQLWSLKEKFEHSIGYKSAWVGLENGKWRTDNVKPFKRPLQYGSGGCGDVCLTKSPPTFADIPCVHTRPFLCQKVQ